MATIRGLRKFTDHNPDCIARHIAIGPTRHFDCEWFCPWIDASCLKCGLEKDHDTFACDPAFYG